jgi:hypothetical protein
MSGLVTVPVEEWAIPILESTMDAEKEHESRASVQVP